MILVTGITGHSGKYFLKELINNRYSKPIRCIVRDSSDTSLLDNNCLGIEKIIGDLNDTEFLDKVMTGVDEVIHISSIYYSLNVVKAALKCNVKRIILVHTTGIFSKYKSASEEYKQIESAIFNLINSTISSMGLIILRPTMIYGYLNDRNMIKFIKMVDYLRIFPVINHGKCLLQPVNGRDLGIAYYQVLCNSEIMDGDYILSGDRPISMIEMFKMISEKLSKKTIFINVPLYFGVSMARVLKFITFGNIDYIEKVQRMGEDRSFSHNNATGDFNYTPMTFDEGLSLEIAEYQSIKQRG